MAAIKVRNPNTTLAKTDIGLLECPARGEGIESPNLGSLLSATALIVAPIAKQKLMLVIPNARPFIAQTGGDGSPRQRAAFDPFVCRVRSERRQIVGDPSKTQP